MMNVHGDATQNSEHDEIDQRLIHALQISPRARWTALAPIIGVDSVTLARRWSRLTDEGLAWVTGYPGQQLRGPAALLEVECHPGATVDISAELAADEEAFTVDLTAGGREMLVLIVSQDMTGLTSYVMERMRGLEGIRSTRTHLLSTAFAEAGQWRLRSLAPDEVAAVERTVSVRPASWTKIDPELEIQLLLHLGNDGRATVSAMAKELGASQRRVRETLTSMLAQERVVMRTHMAKSHSGWPIHAWYFLKVPAAIVEKVGSTLGRLGEIRLAVSTVGLYNLVLAVWMRTLADVQRLEVMIEEKLPGVNIADRSVVLRTVKNMGHRLDQFERSTGQYVPFPMVSARAEGRSR